MLLFKYKLTRLSKIILAMLLILIIVGVFYYLNLRNEKIAELAKLPTRHTCAASPFRINLPPGGEARFTIELDNSELGKSYIVNIGNLPNGVRAQTLSFEGRSAQQLIINLYANGNAQLGNFSIPILYFENIGYDIEKETNCQFNLIIE